VKFLIENGIDTEIREKKGRTAKEVAIRYKKHNIGEYIDQIKLEVSIMSSLKDSIKNVVNNEMNSSESFLKIIEQQNCIIKQQSDLIRLFLKQQSDVEEIKKIITKKD
jgi:hypothetical protein